MRWPIILTLLLIVVGIIMAALLLPSQNNLAGSSGSATPGVLEGVPIENWEDYVDPTFPAVTAIPIPTEPAEHIPLEPTPEMPEVTPWPTPPDP